MPFTLPDLPYSYDALEPYIDARTMEIHYSKHHQGYTDKLNTALEGTDLADKEIEDILSDLSQVPEDIRTAVQNNGGGYANHGLFWEIMSPEENRIPEELENVIKEAFGDMSSFQKKFSEVATTRFGSGWAWLVVNSDKTLEVMSTANQNSPLSEGKLPILGLDVWEHAYYLKYKNKRPEYIEAFWQIVNWTEVARRYQEAK